MPDIKVNPAYKPAVETDSRYRIIYGGAGSGKSYFVAQETIINMLEHNDFHYLVVRKTGKSIKNSVFALLVDIIASNGLSSLFHINKSDMSITAVTGSTLITSGLDDVEKLKSIININRIWVEESSEISESDFDQLDLRMRGKSKQGHTLTMTFNPISELHWIKKRFFDVGEKNSFILKTTYKNNVFIDEQYKRTLENLKDRDYQFYRVYALGEWGSIGNLIYTNWRKEDLSDIKDSFDNHFNGLDFGFASDPTAFVRVHLDKKRRRIYVVDEWYQSGMFIDDIAKEIKPYVGNEIVTCDSSEPRSIEDLKRNSIKAVGAKKGPGSIEHGIKWLQGYEIIVDESCINTVKELTSYKWREDKDGNIIPKPVDINNHILDALRYGLENEMKQTPKLKATIRI